MKAYDGQIAEDLQMCNLFWIFILTKNKQRLHEAATVAVIKLLQLPTVGSPRFLSMDDFMWMEVDEVDEVDE